MGIALIVVMGAFIKICAVHTPSSNPRKPKARQLTLPRTLQRRRHHHNQQQQQQQGHGNRGGNSGAQSSSGARERRPLARSVEERKPNRPVPAGGASHVRPQTFVTISLFIDSHSAFQLEGLMFEIHLFPLQHWFLSCVKMNLTKGKKGAYQDFS